MVLNAILLLDCFHRYIKAKTGMVSNIAPGVVSKGTGVAGLNAIIYCLFFTKFYKVLSKTLISRLFMPKKTTASVMVSGSAQFNRHLQKSRDVPCLYYKGLMSSIYELGLWLLNRI